MARSNKVLVPDAKQNLDSFKMEVANSLNVNLKQGYNGDISAKDAGSIGGNMVKRMITYAENNMNGSGNNMMK
ncbi:MAG: alpha/beta-type small acid-soluble spore protein [Clostridia bacterium]|nr:alpha/beta-type small acid-soluble spore protein [Clostridia bacterium]MBR4019489.1 alpha/beta-type small acid-soluble spore protein [Clostridia bacterium]